MDQVKVIYQDIAQRDQEIAINNAKYFLKREAQSGGDSNHKKCLGEKKE
ncbi:MAG: hypothetical protein QXQ02_03625 [Halobacteria archaeon]